jgi:hypothetical protein
MQVTELVGEGTIDVAGAEAALKITADAYNDHLLPDKQVPTSWYMCHQKAMEGHEPFWVHRDFCNGNSAGKMENADHLFPEDLEAQVCLSAVQGQPFQQERARTPCVVLLQPSRSYSVTVRK